MAPRLEQFKVMVRQARDDIFDQSSAVGRLSLVQVAMLAGDTLVTISLAGSLFFSLSPDAAESKVFYYLLFTLAPFAIVSPLLGPLIDRSRSARRAMVVISAVGRAVLCPFMALNVHSLLLFPLAFGVLVLSKLYLVTRGALVPEVAASTTPGASGEQSSYATLNARLTLLGTVAGFVISVPGVIILKTIGAPGVCSSTRWSSSAPPSPAPDCPRSPRGARGGPRVRRGRAARGRPGPTSGTPTWSGSSRWPTPRCCSGLSAMSIIRGLQGFQIFLLAFGLRRLHVGLYVYGLALSASGVGAIVGLALVGRLREPPDRAAVAAGRPVAHRRSARPASPIWGALFAQVLLAFIVGLAGAVAQPSFDAMTQRYIPPAAQGRAFARFATRQQLVWVLGSLIPVVIHFNLPQGDAVMAALAAIAGLFYVTGRRALHAPRMAREPGAATS